jgi:hypothetical protein
MMTNSLCQSRKSCIRRWSCCNGIRRVARVCKTFIRRFNSDPRLQHKLFIQPLPAVSAVVSDSGEFLPKPDQFGRILGACQAFCQALSGLPTHSLIEERLYRPGRGEAVMTPHNHMQVGFRGAFDGGGSKLDRRSIQRHVLSEEILRSRPDETSRGFLQCNYEHVPHSTRFLLIRPLEVFLYDAATERTWIVPVPTLFGVVPVPRRTWSAVVQFALMEADVHLQAIKLTSNGVGTFLSLEYLRRQTFKFGDHLVNFWGQGNSINPRAHKRSEFPIDASLELNTVEIHDASSIGCETAADRGDGRGSQKTPGATRPAAIISQEVPMLMLGLCLGWGATAAIKLELPSR